MLAMARPISSIYFRFIKEPLISATNIIAQPLFTTRYNFKDSKGNHVDVDINLKESLFFYKSFNGDTVKIRNNAIKVFNPYRKEWEKIPIVKDDVTIFSRFRSP